MITEVHEAIKVGVIFGDNKKKLKPVWFIWNGTKYTIRKITYIWKERVGKTVIHYFTVTEGANFFSISYNTDTLIPCYGHSIPFIPKLEKKINNYVIHLPEFQKRRI